MVPPKDAFPNEFFYLLIFFVEIELCKIISIIINWKYIIKYFIKLIYVLTSILDKEKKNQFHVSNLKPFLHSLE
jgi:hypothetical protein